MVFWPQDVTFAAMKAALIYDYGDPEVFRIEEIPEPVLRENEILVQVHAASVNPVDWKQRKGNHRFFLRAKFPIVPGYDISGVVVRTRNGNSRFQPGDEVYCRLRRKFGGAFAELAAAPESATAFKPSNLDHLESAGIPLAGQTALQAMRDKGSVRPGMKVLVIGAAGGVGHFALQIAREMGAETTAVCSSRHHALLEKLKPDHHIDYQKIDYLNGPIKYDLIFDAAGAESFLTCKNILVDGGTYITNLPRPKLIAHKLLALFTRGKRVRTLLQRPRSTDLEYLSRLVEEGKLQVIIDSVYPLEKISHAHRRAEEYQTEGKIIIQIR
jgi:NADPH:quinone reductase-like Zn-dependent oxidoreductase